MHKKAVGGVRMEALRSVLESALGEVYSLDAEAPGIWFVVAAGDGAAREYYLVERDSETVSAEAKRCGAPLPGHPELLLYAVDVLDSGYQIVRYEAAMYQHSCDSSPETLRELRNAAIFGAETHPAYFGDYPPPLDTPRGRMLRNRRIWTGIWGLETDWGERLLAFCAPLWKPELSLTALCCAQRPEWSWTRGVYAAGEYLFFDWAAGCIPLYEWLCLHPEHRNMDLLNYAALKNVICDRFTDYARQANERLLARRQCGVSRAADMAEPADELIKCVPEAGYEFLKF